MKISLELKRKVEIICKLACIKPHIVKIKDINYLIFDECDDIFINDYLYTKEYDYDDRDIDI